MSENEIVQNPFNSDNAKNCSSNFQSNIYFI